MFLLMKIGQLLSGRQSFGEGDIFILAGLGTVFGVQNVLYMLLFGAIFQAIFVIPIYFKSLIVQKDWKLLISFVTLALFAVLFCYNAYGQNSNDILYIAAFILLTANTVVTCYLVIKGIKTEKNITYVPFGPFLALSGLAALLAPQIFMYLVHMLHALVGIV